MQSVTYIHFPPVTTWIEMQKIMSNKKHGERQITRWPHSYGTLGNKKIETKLKQILATWLFNWRGVGSKGEVKSWWLWWKTMSAWVIGVVWTMYMKRCEMLSKSYSVSQCYSTKINTISKTSFSLFYHFV